MRRLAFPVLVSLVIASATFVAATLPQLPDRIAIHFDSSGQANGWMTRDQYRVFSLGLAVGLPLLVTATFVVAPRFSPRSIKLPNRDYWMADVRREQTLATLGAFGCWFGCLLTLLAAGVHYAILQAHQSAPAQLPMPLFTGLLVAFFAGVMLWVTAFHVRFRKHG